MTTDIVERLRACNCDIHCKSGCVQEKAADEIERLRAALTDIEELVDGYADADDGQPNLAMRVQTVARIAMRREP